MTADLFGTPEPVREEPRIFSVSELTRSVRSVLEDNLGVVWVEGEISNYRKQASGHQYFTLKDAQSQLSCVWFARQGSRLKQTPLADGMQVQVRGAMTVYEARGQYQLNVQLAQAGGAGLLQAKFEALKRKLEAEGAIRSGSKTRAAPISRLHRHRHVSDRRRAPGHAEYSRAARSMGARGHRPGARPGRWRRRRDRGGGRGL